MLLVRAIAHMKKTFETVCASSMIYTASESGSDSHSRSVYYRTNKDIYVGLDHIVIVCTEGPKDREPIRRVWAAGYIFVIPPSTDRN